MCLSTVFLFDGEKEIKVAEKVGSLKVEEDCVIISDLLGFQTKIPGKVENIDLIDNYIILRKPAQ